MAGKRQHIIPKFLQKGFASRVEDDTAWTWHYRKDAQLPVEISTKDSIVSKHFYGRGADNADDVITELERTKLASVVDSLRAGEKRTSREIAELVVHVSVRTKLIRKGFEKISEQFLTGLGEMLSDQSLMAEVLGKTPDAYFANQFDVILSQSDKFKGIEEVMAFFASFALRKEDVSELVVKNMREQITNPDNIDQIAQVFGEVFLGAMPLVRDSVKDGHVRGLRENPMPTARVDIFERFNWSAKPVKFDLILGDCGTLFKPVKTEAIVASCDDAKVELVFLPIAKNLLLIGKRGGHVVQDIDESLNDAIARCSYEQFISASITDENVARIPYIGSNSQLGMEDEVADELAAIKNNLSGFFGMEG